MSVDPATALGGLPASLRSELLVEYDKIVRNYREGRWETAELDGGRFCEIVYSILKGQVDGSYPASASKPRDFPGACTALAQATAFPQSVRLGIPRVLIGLYEVRNNRGVGHVGGEVDANHMDATYVLHSVQWVLAELVRIFHSTTTSAATAVVDALVDRTLPIIWTVDTKRRVLTTGLTLATQTLLLVYGEPNGRLDRELSVDLEQARLANYKRVLKSLHADRLVEYQADGNVLISPKGAKLVEEQLLPGLAD